MEFHRRTHSVESVARKLQNTWFIHNFEFLNWKYVEIQQKAHEPNWFLPSFSNMHWMLLFGALLNVAQSRNATVFNWNGLEQLEQNSLSPILPGTTQMERDLEDQQEQWALLARENVLRMRSDSIRCATPRPRVIKVQNVHPHASKRYVPSCVALHRCDREAGCCDNEQAICSPTTKQRIYMYFYVVTLEERNGLPSIGVYGQVERLRFTNHTQCGCRKRKAVPLTPKLEHSMNSANSVNLLMASMILVALVCSGSNQMQL